MKDQFYIVLPSNSSLNYYSENKTIHFVTQLPKQINLQGSWTVAMTEIRIPLTFQHLPPAHEERYVCVQRCLKGTLVDYFTLSSENEIPTEDASKVNLIQREREEDTKTVSTMSPGVYKDVDTFILEINSLDCMKKHFQLKRGRGDYVTIERLCTKAECIDFNHKLDLAPRLKAVLGFDDVKEIAFESNDFVEGVRPANLSNCLPSMLMVYTDICEPYFTGDVQTRLLRAVSLGMDEYTYGGLRCKSFSPPMYLDLLYKSFETIEIDIRDEYGKPIPFDFGCLTVTLSFRKTD